MVRWTPEDSGGGKGLRSPLDSEEGGKKAPRRRGKIVQVERSVDKNSSWRWIWGHTLCAERYAERCVCEKFFYARTLQRATEGRFYFRPSAALCRARLGPFLYSSDSCRAQHGHRETYSAYAPVQEEYLSKNRKTDLRTIPRSQQISFKKPKKGFVVFGELLLCVFPNPTPSPRSIKGWEWDWGIRREGRPPGRRSPPSFVKHKPGRRSPPSFKTTQT